MQPATSAHPVSPHALSAYGRLASEYDQPTHRTTRVLEALSERGLRKAHQQADLRAVEHVFEIGAGTGALTRAAIELWPNAHLIATDPSPEMLDVLKRRIVSLHPLVEVAAADSSTAAGLSNVAPDVVVAGLADPYLDSCTAGDLRAICTSTTSLFVSTPSRSWAIRERHGRLGVDHNRTRFRLRDGSVVFAPSLTYDQEQLCELLRQAGFSILCADTERSTATWTHPQVCWVLARPTLTPSQRD